MSDFPFSRLAQAYWQPFKRRYDKLDNLANKANKSLDAQSVQLETIYAGVLSLQQSVHALETRISQQELLSKTNNNQLNEQLSRINRAIQSIEHLLTLNDVSNEEIANELKVLHGLVGQLQSTPPAQVDEPEGSDAAR